MDNTGRILRCSLRRRRGGSAEGGEVTALRAVLRANLDRAPSLEVVKQLDRGLRRQVLEEPVVDLDHRRIHARAEALHLGEREKTIVARGTPRLDSQVRF